MVLVCGGRVKDFFGVCYYIVWGILDIVGVKDCKNFWFKYGGKKLKE